MAEMNAGGVLGFLFLLYSLSLSVRLIDFLHCFGWRAWVASAWN